MKKIILSFLIISTFACTNNTDNHNRSEVDYSSYGDSLSLSDLKINNQLSNIKWKNKVKTRHLRAKISISKDSQVVKTSPRENFYPKKVIKLFL